MPAASSPPCCKEGAQASCHRMRADTACELTYNRSPNRAFGATASTLVSIMTFPRCHHRNPHAPSLPAHACLPMLHAHTHQPAYRHVGCCRCQCHGGWHGQATWPRVRHGCFRCSSTAAPRLVSAHGWLLHATNSWMLLIGVRAHAAAAFLAPVVGWTPHLQQALHGSTRPRTTAARGP